MADTEKITINLGSVDLGKIDLLVEESFYSNRTDFIRTAIRNQLDAHGEVLQQTVSRRAIVVGVLGYSRDELEELRAERTMIDIRAIGSVVFKENIPPDLVRATIKSIQLFGVLRASPEVKEALEDRLI